MMFISHRSSPPRLCVQHLDVEPFSHTVDQIKQPCPRHLHGKLCEQVCLWLAVSKSKGVFCVSV